MDEDDDEHYEPRSALELGVRGYACHIFDDPRTAWALHREQHLIPWRMQSDLRVDRFDARNLLDDRASFRQLKRPRSAGSTTDAERALHALRYADYEVEFPRPAAPGDEQDATPSVENAFAYTYPEDRDDDNDNADGSASHREPFEPPWVVPAHIVQPTSKKLHEVIAATAKKARMHPQLEVMLKVKLHANATFGFLTPAHGFHAYYVYLRDTDPPMRPSVPVAPVTQSAVSLLGAEYDDDESDSDSSSKSETVAVEVAACSSDDKAKAKDESGSSDSAVTTAADAHTKAMRLRRAKALASHFQRAMASDEHQRASPTRPSKRHRWDVQAETHELNDHE